MSIQVKVIKLASTKNPKFLYNKSKEYVSYGDENNYPQYLLELSNKSALHSAILDKKFKGVQGLGFSYEGDINKNLDNFLENPNPNESMEDLLEKIVNDLEIFGGYYLQVIWNKAGTKILELYHMPFEKIRTSKMNEKGQIETFYYCDDWKKYIRWTDVEEYPAYSTTDKKNKVQIFRASKYHAGSPYYPIPSYIGATLDVETLAGISDFHNSNLKNSFNPGLLVVFRGPEPTPEEMDTIVQNIQTKYGGTENAGSPMVFFLDGEQQEPKIEQMQASDLDKLFDQLQETSKENVTLAHGIPRIVAGLEKEGSLGGSKEIVEAELIFRSTYIEPEQNFITRTMNKLLKPNNYPELIILNKNASIILYSESLLEKVLTQDEMREIFGYDVLEIKEDTIEEDTDNIEEGKPTADEEVVEKIDPIEDGK